MRSKNKGRGDFFFTPLIFVQGFGFKVQGGCVKISLIIVIGVFRNQNPMKPDLVKRRIYTIRDLQVLLDFDLAELYEVENRALKQAVRRNSERFPDDFMFQLTKAEWQELITICDNLPEGVKFSPTPPFAFTEQGVAMLSGVLRGLKAVQVNIAIMRAFVLMRQFALSHVELTRQLKELEQRYDRQFNDIFDAIGYLMEGEKREEQHYQRKSIGFKRNSEDPL